MSIVTRLTFTSCIVEQQPSTQGEVVEKPHESFRSIMTKRFDMYVAAERLVRRLQWLRPGTRETRPHLYVAMNHVVVVAVPKRLQDLPHVVAGWTECEFCYFNALSAFETLYPRFPVGVLPGHRFAVHEAGIGSLHDLETQVGSVHTERRKSVQRGGYKSVYTF